MPRGFFVWGIFSNIFLFFYPFFCHIFIGFCTVLVDQCHFFLPFLEASEREADLKKHLEAKVGAAEERVLQNLNREKKTQFRCRKIGKNPGAFEWMIYVICTVLCWFKYEMVKVKNVKTKYDMMKRGFQIETWPTDNFKRRFGNVCTSELINFSGFNSSTKEDREFSKSVYPTLGGVCLGFWQKFSESIFRCFHEKRRVLVWHLWLVDLPPVYVGFFP